MNRKEELEKMLESVNSRIQSAFETMLDSASDSDVRKYENLLKQRKSLENQLYQAEALEAKRSLENGGYMPEDIRRQNTKMKQPLDEKTKFVMDLREAVSKGTTFSGLLPREVASEIQRKKENLAKIRGLCTIHQATGEYTVYVEGDEATVAYVGEATEIDETSPTIEPIGLAALKLAAIIKVSREFLNDLGVDVMAYLVDTLAKAFARKEDSEILFGTGTASGGTAIRGISANITAANTVTASSSTEVTWEEVKSTIQKLSAYRQNATIVCSQLLLDACHSFKDDDHYIFPQNQEITQIMGIPVVVSDEFPTFATGNIVMIVGDFSYYHFLERQGIETMTLYELYAATDQIGIRAVERIDGAPVPEAFAMLQLA